ncbi:putative monooxygenase p33MONOX [Polypterus senegalus]|uniref:putative monooxygenase p33MONOX n=1 Tax=Polypterus senegalus TaxID=55291 RepID=UPI001963D2A7|nr:putative monooxygenase p33MONOX [Polypterus senegalus]
MSGRPSELPALESSASEGLLGQMSLPVGIVRRAFSYDDALDDLAPMTPPPSDIGSNILWKNPVIPERKYQHLSEVDESSGVIAPPTSSSSMEVIDKPPVPVVKAKATSIIMNSLITKQTQESMQRFERQAGLTDTGYTPHKGLTAEDTRYHRVAEAMHKLKMQSADSKDEKQSTSTQSTPSGTPQSSPKQKRRGWFSQSSSASLTSSDFSSSNSSVDLGTGEGTAMDKWSIFGPRPASQKSSSDPRGFALQSYRGAQKPSPMEIMRAQATLVPEEPANFKPPKMDIPVIEEKKHAPRSHNLKPRDMNVLTPSGF